MTDEEGLTVPRTGPTTRTDRALWTDKSPDAQFVSPVYDALDTNIPHTMMNFSDLNFAQGSSLFPRHETVLEYLQEYARGLEPLLTFQTQVLDVRKVEKQGQQVWELEVLDLKSQTVRKAEFDAVVVASGHYNDPFIPGIPGLAEFNKAHPGAITHSKLYKRPDDYVNKVRAYHSGPYWNRC